MIALASRPRLSLASRASRYAQTALIGLAWLTMGSSLAAQKAPPVHFAVIGNVPTSVALEAPTRALLDTLASSPDITFILDNGNLKGTQEPCSDALLQDRLALLNSSPLPLVFVPGANDWIDCQQAAAGAFDPLERLDFIRENYPSTNAMGAGNLPLMHESDIPRFRHFHENAQWQVANVLFITLNLASLNNHYIDAGGRNGEFDDRAIADRYWLTHAVRSARARHATVLVIAVEGDPGIDAKTHHSAFPWLDFHRTRRDGYLEFKQDLQKVLQEYNGAILLINRTQESLGNSGADHNMFRLYQPLHHKNGSPRTQLWQLEINTQNDANHWLSVEITPGREPPFKASLQTVPADRIAHAIQAAQAAQAALAASSTIPAASSATAPPVALPVPVLQIPGSDAAADASMPHPEN